MDKLEKHDLYLKPKKCTFEKEKINYLGIIIRQGTIKLDLSKLKGVADWQKSNIPIKVRQFL